MLAGTLLGVLIASGAAVWVAWPLFRGESNQGVEELSPLLARARDLESQREMMLATLRDMDEDRATNKLDPRDHAELHGRLAVEAAHVLREIEETRSALDAEERRRHPVLPYPAPRRSESADD